MKQPNNSYNLEVAARLALIRKWASLNKSEFARGAEIDESYYTIFEAGKKRISLECARRLSKAYGVHLSWIYDGVASPELPAGLHRLVTKRRANNGHLE